MNFKKFPYILKINLKFDYKSIFYVISNSRGIGYKNKEK